MSRALPALHNAARLGFAALVVVAITYQYASGTSSESRFAAANFFSFFTIQSNILAAALLAVTATVPAAGRTRLFDGVLLRCAVLLVGFVGAALAFVAIGNRRARSR